MVTLSREQELAALYALCRLPAHWDTLEQVGAMAVEQATGLLGCETVVFYVYQVEEDLLRPQAAMGVALKKLQALPATASGPLVAQTLTATQPLAWAGADATALAQTLGAGQKIEAALSIPIRSGETLLGLLYAARTGGAAFDATERNLGELLAGRVSESLHNISAAQRPAATPQSDALSILNRFSLSVSSALTLEEILTRVDAQVNQLFDTTNFYIATYEPGSEEWCSAWRIVRGERQSPAWYSIHTGLTGYIITTREPVFLPNLEANRAFLEAHGMSLLGEQAKSWMGVPLISADQVVGAMAVENYEHEDVFSEQDALLFSTISSQVANAIQAARLFGETRRRTAQLQAAAEISRAASSLFDLDELLPRAVNLIRERLELYYAGIFLVDDTGQWAVLRAATGEAGQKMLARGHKLSVGDTSMIGACISERKARILLDVDLQEEERFTRFNNPDLPETRSEMALPLIARGGIIGAMTIQDTRAAAFSEADITVLQTMADQLANAIANARLFADSQQRLLDLQALQRSYTAETWSDYSARQEVLGYSYDLNRVAPLEASVAVETLSGTAFEEGKVVAYSGSERPGGGASLFAPVVLQGETIGLLGFEETEEPREWSEDDLSLVEAVRDQLGLALQNRLLFTQTQEALRETGALYEINTHISEAHTIDEVLHATASGIIQRPEPDHVVIGLLEPLKQPENFRVVASHDRSGPAAGGGVYPLEYWGSLLEALKAERRFVESDVEQNETFNELLLSVYRRIGARGLVALPLNVQQMRYGIVLIYTHEPHDFSAEELRFYETVVQQSSVALENLYLFESTQMEAEQRAILNEVLQTATRSLDPAEMMRDVGEVVALRFQMPTMLWRWTGERIQLVSTHRADGMEVSLAAETEFAPGDMPGVGSAIVTQEPLLIRSLNMADMHPQIREMITYLALEEVFAVPLMSRDKVLGVLVLGRQKEHPAIDDSEIAFLRLAGVNVSVALENARLYQEAQETAEQLREVDRLKSEFLANMSHELRTPLNSIIGFSRVILKGIDGPLTEMQRTDLQAIYDSGQHLLGLINDILDISKIEAGKMEFTFEPTDINDIVRGVMSTAIALVKDKPVELQQSIPEGLPLIMVDARRIRQVLLNLVNNAAKFTEEGFVRVSVEQEDRFVIFGVQDSGIGIPESKLDDIFEPFTQVDTSSTRRYQGTGLGLPISKKFIEAHGGRIWVESRMGYGSTFFFSLPIAGPNAPLEPANEESAAESDRIVLTVDDDDGVVTLFRRYLGKQGYQVVGLSKGEKTVEEAKRLRPFAITLDIMMPDKDGWQVIRELKSDPETRDIPVIVCSILSETDKGLSMGVADYLVKPILEQDLLSALSRLEQAQSSYVLVVDDNPDDRKLLRRILEDAQYTVEECTGGAEAIAKIHDSPPGLVVLDLMMPEVDGFAVLENLKSQDLTRNIPVVVVTAKELTPEEHTVLQQRVQSLLQKGLFSQARLLEDVSQALERLKTHAAEPEGGASS